METPKKQGPLNYGKITPFDMELFLMVEDLTHRACNPKNAGNGRYFIEVDYSERPQTEFVSALIDAVAGRLGDRLVEIKDQPDAQRFIAMVEFSKDKYTEIYRIPHRKTSEKSFGEIFINTAGESYFALQVNEKNIAGLLNFVGGGEYEIPESGPAVFHFLNAGQSVWQHAKEGQFVVWKSDGYFIVMDEEKFKEIIDK